MGTIILATGWRTAQREVRPARGKPIPRWLQKSRQDSTRGRSEWHWWGKSLETKGVLGPGWGVEEEGPSLWLERSGESEDASP